MQKEETQDCYIGSVNRALDYINGHYSEELTLDILAAKGCFSPCHFHRIFKGIVGETHQKFINRIRLEKAVLMMDGAASITDIAMAVGFSTPAHFAQAFKSLYKITPRAYRKKRASKKHKNPIVLPVRSTHTSLTSGLDGAISLKELPPYRIAYVRHIGGYDFRIGFAWKKLMTWARNGGHLSPDSVRISCSWDDPELTEDGKRRYDACVSVPATAEAEGVIGIRTIKGGLFAVFGFEGTTERLSDFYDRVYGELLPAMGLALRDEPSYRVHLESPVDQIRGRFKNELRIPVQAR